jgi:hypothetical protein
MTSLLPVLLLTLPAAAPPVPSAHADPPSAVVVVRSLDELVANASYLGGPLGMKEETGKLKSMLDVLAGLDRSRPAGLYVRWPWYRQHPDADDVVAFARVLDEKQFLASCRLLGTLTPAGAYHQLTLSDGDRVFLRLAGGRVYVADAPEGLRSLPPEDVLTFPREETGILLARAWPRKARGLIELMRPTVRQGAAMLKGLMPTLNPEARTQMDQSIEVMAGGLGTLIGVEIGELNLRIRIDREKDDLDVQFTVQPNTELEHGFLAGACRYLGQARGRFTPLLRDTAFAVQVIFPVAGKPVKEANLPSVPNELLDFIPLRYQDVSRKMCEAVMATLMQDGLNAAFLMYPDSTNLFAIKFRQGRKLDFMVRDLYRGASAAERKSIRLKLNQDRVGSTRIHQIQDDDKTLHLAVRDDLIVIGTVESPGKKHLHALLTAPLTPEEPPGPFLRIESRGGWFATDPELWKKFRKEAPRTEPSALHAHLHLEGGSCLRLKVRMHTHMLTALRLLAGDE